MDKDSKVLLIEAVNTLVEDTEAKVLFKQMEWVAELARKGVSVGLTGRAVVLNPLLTLWSTDAPTFERVIDLVERKRSDRGLDPISDSLFDRRGYMRELMAAKRQRLGTLVKLVNSMRSTKDRIMGSARMEFERVHAARWLSVREERELTKREKLGRRLSLVERQSIIAQLWADVDTELAELELFVQSEIRKPLNQRAPDGYKFKLQPKKDH